MTTAPRFSFLIFPLFFAFLMSGCNPVNTTINSTDIYQGYPCSDHCDQFQSGYEIAQARQFTQSTDCQSLPTAQKIGCLSYMHEYTITNNQPTGYYFP